jgi:hypothetical protein
MDFFSRRRIGISLVVLFGLSAIAMAVDAFPPLANWSAPVTYTPAKSSGARTLSDISNALPFIGITPCRQFDLRPATLADNTPLAITLTGAPCGIPANAGAVSLNITVFSISGAGGNGVFKVGTVNPPVTAWLNYPPTETQRGNAGALPLNGSGQIWVQVNQGGGTIQLTVDVNGYYSETPASTTGFFGIVENLAAPGGVIVGQNTNTSTAGSYGGDFIAASTGNGSAGVHGSATGTSGIISGVLGEMNSAGTAGAAGVIGSAKGAPNANYTSNFGAGGIGVLGLNTGNYAVAGVSDFIAGNFVNVSGAGTTQSKLQFGLAADAMKAFGNVAINAWQAMNGDLAVAGTLTKGGGAFKIDDPVDPANRYLYHSFVESPDMMNIYNGNVVLDHNGEAVVTLPDYFEALNMDFRYQLTSVGKFSPVYVAEEIQNNQFVIAGGRPYGKVSWQVTGIRHDPFANANRIPNEVEKEKAARGFYLHPAAYGKGPEMDLTQRLEQAAAAPTEK